VKRATMNSRSSQRGLSLVELMISLVLGGLIIAAVGAVYMSSRQSFRTQDAMARMQEGARYAFETMAVDMRQVGFGCHQAPGAAPDLVNWYTNVLKQPLRGYQDGAGLPASITGEIAGTDALMVLRADKSREVLITAAGTAAADVPFEAGGLALVTYDYSDASQHAATAAAGATYTLGAAEACKTGVADSANNRLLPVAGHLYFIRNNAAGEPSLYRETLLANGTTEAQELVEGVEDMEVLYGEDTSFTVAYCPEDTASRCSADVYVAADAVANWNRVVSVRVSLTMRTVADNIATEVSAEGDRRIRKIFTTTIAVRNRL
jgi:type IV pilus assembly protein PilW